MSKTEVSVFLEDKLVQRRVVNHGEYLIGSVSEAEIRFTAEGLAPRHALLSIRPTGWMVHDLGSRFGTYVDDRLVKEPCPVNPGQNIITGKGCIILSYVPEEDDTLLVEPATRPEPGTGSVSRPSQERRYRIGSVVARGGMGSILEAQELSTQRHVAMKVMLNASEPVSLGRFVREAQITANLEHPNIVPVHELGVNEAAEPYYTMKLVKGTSLKDVLELLAARDTAAATTYPLAALLIVFQKICDAAAFAHANGVIHRDLKPENVMLGEYGEALLMDWGLAKRLGEQHPGDLADGSPAGAGHEEGAAIDSTMAGTVMGTPQYMSPEQARGEIMTLDARTDIYSLGAILYHILTLRPPFYGKSKPVLLEDVRAGRTESPSAIPENGDLPHVPRGRIPDSLEAVTVKAMSLQPKDRYQTVVELQAEVTAYQNGFATAAEQAGALKHFVLFLARHRTLTGAFLALVALGTYFTIRLVSERDNANRARDKAEDSLYLSNMMQAWSDIQEGSSKTAYDYLMDHRSEGSGRNLRGWEWYYTLGQLNQDCLRTRAHQDGVFSMAASPTGDRIVTGGKRGDIAIWKTEGLAVDWKQPQAHQGEVRALAWSPDGLIASGGADGVARIWNSYTHDKVKELRLPTLKIGSDAISSLAWDPTAGANPRLAIAGKSSNVYLWRVSESEPVPFPCPIDDASIAGLSWSGDGKKIAIAVKDAPMSVRVYDVESGRETLREERDTSESDVLGVAFDPTSQYLASVSKHRTLSIFDLQTNTKGFERLHRGFVDTLAWSPDGQWLASAGQDCVIRILAVPPPGRVKPVQVPPTPLILCGHVSEIHTLVWTRLPGPDLTRSALFSGDEDGNLLAWRMPPGQNNLLPGEAGNEVTSARWSPDGRRIAITRFHEPRIEIFDASSKESISLPMVNYHPYDAQWSPSGDRLAAVTRNQGLVEVYDATSGKALLMLACKEVNRVAWSQSGKKIATCSQNEARVWDASTGASLGVYPKGVGSVLWGDDDEHLILGEDNGKIIIWDIAVSATDVLRSAHPEPPGVILHPHEPTFQVFDLAWSPDRKLLTFVTQDGAAGLLDPVDGRLVRKLGENITGLRRVAWSPSGKRVAVCGEDGVLRIFNPAKDEDQVAQLVVGRGDGEIQALDWSPDGRKILTGLPNGNVRIWDADPGMQMDEADLLPGPAQEEKLDAPHLIHDAETFAKLGRVDRAEHAFSLALRSAAEPAKVRDRAAEARAHFAVALESQGHQAEASSATACLNAIFKNWNVRSDLALEAYRQLCALPDRDKALPLARRYLSRSVWTACWFQSTIDPQRDPEGWRKLAEACWAASEPRAEDDDEDPVLTADSDPWTKLVATAGATRASGTDRPSHRLPNPWVLSFPYHGHGPRSLGVSDWVTEKGPTADNFGMLARATYELPAGKWVIHAEADGGIRVFVDGKAVLDSWKDGPSRQIETTFPQTAAGRVEVSVEHYCAKASQGIEVLLYPDPGQK